MQIKFYFPSVSTDNGAAKSAVDNMCSTDYLIVIFHIFIEK